MYGLFYASYMLFGGITAILGGVKLLDAFRKHEEVHQANLVDARHEGYWTGFGNAWPMAFRSGEESALRICQELAMESADLIGLDQPNQQQLGLLVQSWPEFVLTPWPSPTSTSDMFLE